MFAAQKLLNGNPGKNDRLALASKVPALNVTRIAPSNHYNAVVYEIWCAGLSPDIFNAIEAHQAETWNSLLRASYSPDVIYKDGANVGLTRAIYPGSASEKEHWDSWVAPELATQMDAEDSSDEEMSASEESSYEEMSASEA